MSFWGMGFLPFEGSFSQETDADILVGEETVDDLASVVTSVVFRKVGNFIFFGARKNKTKKRGSIKYHRSQL